ncbi:hypothetical protein ABPG77_010440 [Micractinium sp. CCAP 211/92]
MAEEGRTEEAKALLKRELPRLIDKFGTEDPSVGMVYNQLALWAFHDGQLGDAVEAATAAHRVWVKELGEDSQAAAFHGIRLGMVLTADGRPEEAFPLLEKGLDVAVKNYNTHLEQLQALQPLAEDLAAAAQDASEADQQVMAARAEQQRTSVVMLERLGAALQEARFYRALSFLGVRGRELDEKWDDTGAGACFFLEQEMSDAMTDMLRWMVPDHPTVACALREHGRLVAQCRREGLRRVADDLQIHGQRLADLVEEARNGKDG